MCYILRLQKEDQMNVRRNLWRLMQIGALVLLVGAGVSAEPFRVALVLPSTINDFAWSQTMYDAFVAIQREQGEDAFQFVYSENMFVIADAAVAIRDYAAEGYDLVIAHGSQYGSLLVDIAPDFPNTSFAWGSTADTFIDLGITNVFAYEPSAEEGGYLNGILAAKLSKSAIIGGIGPIETGDAKRYAAGFKLGVQAINPDAEVRYVFIGSYSDVALASEAAQTHINAGADVLTGTAQMVVGAIGVARQRGVFWLGYDVDQSSFAPETVAASIVCDWTVALRPMIELIKDGTLGGRILPADFANGGLKFAFNREALVAKGYSTAVIEEIEALLEQTVKDIIQGNIEITVEG
jgi:basic membrane protein A